MKQVLPWFTTLMREWNLFTKQASGRLKIGGKSSCFVTVSWMCCSRKFHRSSIRKDTIQPEDLQWLSTKRLRLSFKGLWMHRVNETQMHRSDSVEAALMQHHLRWPAVSSKCQRAAGCPARHALFTRRAAFHSPECLSYTRTLLFSSLLHLLTSSLVILSHVLRRTRQLGKVTFFFCICRLMHFWQGF